MSLTKLSPVLNNLFQCTLQKKVSGFRVPSQDVTNQTLPSREYFNFLQCSNLPTVICIRQLLPVTVASVQ
jgi:hypothetical protein